MSYAAQHGGRQPLFLGNENIITIGPVADSTSTLLHGAAFTGQLVDEQGNAITTVTFGEAPANDGTYNATIPYSLALPPGDCSVLVTGVSAGRHFSGTILCRVTPQIIPPQS